MCRLGWTSAPSCSLSGVGRQRSRSSLVLSASLPSASRRDDKDDDKVVVLCFRNLEYLDLRTNFIHFLPAAFDNLRELKEFYASNNLLEVRVVSPSNTP